MALTPADVVDELCVKLIVLKEDLKSQKFTSLYKAHSDKEQRAGDAYQPREMGVRIGYKFMTVIFFCSIYVASLPPDLPSNTEAMLDKILEISEVRNCIASILSPSDKALSFDEICYCLGHAFLLNGYGCWDLTQVVSAFDNLAKIIREAILRYPEQIVERSLPVETPPSNFDQAWKAILAARLSGISFPEAAHEDPVLPFLTQNNNFSAGYDVAMKLVELLAMRHLCLNEGSLIIKEQKCNLNSTDLISPHVLAALHQRWFPQDSEHIQQYDNDSWDCKCARVNILLYRIIDTYRKRSRLRWHHFVEAWDKLFGVFLVPALELQVNRAALASSITRDAWLLSQASGLRRRQSPVHVSAERVRALSPHWVELVASHNGTQSYFETMS